MSIYLLLFVSSIFGTVSMKKGKPKAQGSEVSS